MQAVVCGGHHSGGRLAFRLLFCIAACLLALSSPGPLSAQQKPPDAVDDARAKPDAIIADKISSLRKHVDEAEDLDEELKNKVLDTSQQVLDELKRGRDLAAAAAANKAKIDDVQARLQSRTTELEQPASMGLDDVSDTSSLAELEAALAKRQPLFQEAKSALAEREAEPNTRAERRKHVLGLMASLPERKSELEQQLQAPPPSDEPQPLTWVNRALVQARLLTLDKEAPAYQAELALCDAEKAADLPALRARLERRKVARVEQEIAELTKRINAKREQEAAENVTSARAAASEADPALKVEAELNADLAQENQKLSQRIAAVSGELERARKELADLTGLTSRTKEKIDRVGLTGAIGLELRKQLRSLPNAGEIEKEFRARRELLNDIEFKTLAHEDDSRELDDLDGRTDLSDAARQIFKDRKATLNTLVRNYDEYFSKLSMLDAEQQGLVKEIRGYEDYIGKHVLWIRSNRFFSPGDLHEAATTFWWFISPENWTGVVQVIWENVRDHPIPAGSGVVLLVLLLFAQHRCRHTLAEIGRQASRGTFGEFLPTLHAVYLTLLISVVWPVVLGIIGWRLSVADEAGEFVAAFGRGLIWVAVAYLSLNLLRQACRVNGLGGAHFDWPESSLRLLRRRLYSLMILVLPLIGVASTLHFYGNVQGHDSLERLCLIAALAVLGWFLFRVLSPKAGVFRNYLAYHDGNWTSRMQWLWFPLAVALPLVLAGLAVAGYFYTAQELAWRLAGMIGLLVALFFVRALFVRWFVVSHRRLRIEQARERRAAMLEKSEGDESAAPSDIPVLAAEQADLRQLGQQTQRLINTGLSLVGIVVAWFMWADVLPAIRILDNYTMWSVSREVTLADGTGDYRTVRKIEAITPVNLLFATFLAILTVTASRNVPGLVEIVLLQRLPFEPGLRYAIRTVTRYVILIVGVVMVCTAVGLGWSKVQWLAAALTVGLGFGLQEIFANFVSGLIILFEQPLRIGDVVTIDGVTGTVSRIQIRATTITDWDRKEYIVPNKEFITGRMLNWTLSDKTNRIVVNVGVAYGSDTELARTLLLKVAGDHPRILEDPPPVSTFEGFGDSTLNLVLRCYLPSLENRLQTITELHTAIDREFKAAGLEIAFPQRDLHLRTVPQNLELSPVKRGDPYVRRDDEDNGNAFERN